MKTRSHSQPKSVITLNITQPEHFGTALKINGVFKKTEMVTDEIGYQPNKCLAGKGPKRC